MTNATKATILAAANAALGLVTSFGIDLTGPQRSAIVIFVNAALGAWVAATYKNSPKRIPDVPDAPPGVG